MTNQDESVVIYPVSGKVYHRAALETIGTPFSSDPDWFHAEDYAFPICRRDHKGKLTSRALAEEYGHPPCGWCYPRNP